MRHIYSLADAALQRPSLVTIGVYDGVHRGHQSIIKHLVEQAHTSEQAAVVFTFYPHPDLVLGNLQGRYYLTSPEERAERMGALGVDWVVSYPFNDSTRHMRAAEFVDMLLANLKMSELWVGADFALGYQREGNVAFLQQQGAEKGFHVREIDLMLMGGARISSTAIRGMIERGEVDQARQLLGRGYTLSGEVIHGKKRGRTIGYPTANIAVWDQQVIPANGVYAGWGTVSGERYMAMTNVGVSPTFMNDNVTVEAFLLDFNREIYGETLTISFEKYLRSEAKFSGIDALIAQIGEDVRIGREFLLAQAQM